MLVLYKSLKKNAREPTRSRGIGKFTSPLLQMVQELSSDVISHPIETYISSLFCASHPSHPSLQSRQKRERHRDRHRYFPFRGYLSICVCLSSGSALLYRSFQ